jgi:septal ring factor EnvC (AmiA/AmiB activator)
MGGQTSDARKRAEEAEAAAELRRRNSTCAEIERLRADLAAANARADKLTDNWAEAEGEVAALQARLDRVEALAENAKRRMIDDPNGNWWAFLPEEIIAALDAATDT